MTGEELFDLELKCRRKTIKRMRNAETIEWDECPDEVKASYNLMAKSLRFR